MAEQCGRRAYHQQLIHLCHNIETSQTQEILLMQAGCAPGMESATGGRSRKEEGVRAAFFRRRSPSVRSAGQGQPAADGTAGQRPQPLAGVLWKASFRRLTLVKPCVRRQLALVAAVPASLTPGRRGLGTAVSRLAAAAIRQSSGDVDLVHRRKGRPRSAASPAEVRNRLRRDTATARTRPGPIPAQR